MFMFTVRPVLLPFSFGERPMNPGQIITVPCGVIEGDRPISLHWTFNGNPITPRMGVTVVNLGERSVILSISSVQAAHAGHYTCTAKNFAGTDHRSAELVVKGTQLLLFPDTPVCKT
jgi:Immunoglobulin I-set domain.